MAINQALTKALPVLRMLEQHGHEAVFVGGCVRDTIMGKVLKDVDIATSAAPDQVEAAFPRTIPTGLQHGTVTVIHESEHYEVTTFRTESAYEAHRRPAQVQFVADLEADLMRRDFTINAMAMRADGSIVDPFGGRQDLQRRVLRCVGDANLRFQEDALRMVRAVRFAAEFQMHIAPQTWKALRRYSHLLVHIAMERIGAESDKMIGGSNPSRALAWFAAAGLLAYTKTPLPPALVRQAEQFRMDPAADKGKLKGLAALTSLEERWAAFCIALGLSMDDAYELFDAFRFSTSRIGQLKAAVNVHQQMTAFTSSLQSAESPIHDGLLSSEHEQMLHRAWILAVLDNGKAAAACWLHAAAALTCSSLNLDKLAVWLNELAVSSVRELAIGGADLLRLLHKPSGPWLGKLLNELVRDVAIGVLTNDRDSLLDAAGSRLPE
ncbi:CCA tRNA nucleotidyltransferase [Paenibacillus solisilvae]|uniref:CCA tRNA nucleotidyltransferase n=1 Tax=Paenibacillus solisilvae TaxID=2486751 RepID=A0ABW0W014_9BACL